MKILVSDAISEKGIEILKSQPDFEVDCLVNLSPDELMSRIGDYDALIVRSKTKVTKELIEAGKKLKVIGRAGVGVDNIDVDAATGHGIVVLNAPEGNTISAAEHTIALMLALARNLPQAHASLRSGAWKREAFMGTELYGKTLAVLGLGRIGKEVARRAHAMHMEVLAYDPFLSADAAKELGVVPSSFEEALGRADFITVHCPLTKETHHLLGREQFRMMKDGVRIINCARGGIIDEAALYEALVSGKVAGAALDVFEKEPPFGSPLLELDSVIVTPHLGASTEEAQVNVALSVAEQVTRALRGEPFKNAVNVPFVGPQEQAAVRPFMALAEKLGSFVTQLSDSAIKRVTITYGGSLARMDTRLLTNSLLAGLLGPIMTVDVNLVNAPVFARDRGIRVVEAREEDIKDFTSLITVEVKTDKDGFVVAGTLFGVGDPRIVRINEYHVDASAAGHILVIPHVDKPGVIGPVGMVLGRAGINIASMHVGRKLVGGEAIMLLGIDLPAEREVLEEILKVDGVHDVRPVDL